MNPREATRRVKREAIDLGFDRVGTVPLGDGLSAAAADLREWIRRGWHGGMDWMTRRLDERERPDLLLPGARAVVCVAVGYPAPPAGLPSAMARAGRGRISAYAQGDDYHEVVKDRLWRLRDRLVAALSCAAKVCVDTAPVLEKVWAQRAGLGWQGKNTLLIDPERGSYFFLGEILVTADLEPDGEPVADHCGSCTLCLQACPTGALVEGGRIDSNRCISYLTIEHRGPIDPALRPRMGDWIFGCDDCQTACPWNRSPAGGADAALQPRQENRGPALADLLPMGPADFARRFRRSAVKRARRSGFLRNVAVALGNSGDPAGIPALTGALADDDPLVRRHAAWALGRIGGPAARGILEDRSACEPSEEVREEIAAALRPA